MSDPVTQAETPNSAIVLTQTVLDDLATDPSGPVALYLKQRLIPVEGESGVVFPPTYADIGYNIDTLADGTKVATIDSVGSQANRMEPIFKAASEDQPENPLARLVPQLEIVLHTSPDGFAERRSILDLAHRSADAVVHACPELAELVAEAFATLRQKGDAGPLCQLAPTSLVFGVWDSRGASGEKRPRLVRAIVRAWEAEVLHAAAQFTSIAKALTEDQRDELEKEAAAKAKKKAPSEKGGAKAKKELSEIGFADAPAIFRKVGQGAAKYLPEYLDRSPNPHRRILGGILVRGRIEREVTVNLVALRGIRGANAEETRAIHKYLLGLSLVAATAEIDLFLREGCHLRYAGEDEWSQIPRRGKPCLIDLNSPVARALIKEYTADAADHFRPNWPERLRYEFDLKRAKQLLSRQGDDSADGGG